MISETCLQSLDTGPLRFLKGGLDIWYHSPFRTEKEPSFHIRAGRQYDWVWYDFGQDGSSTILDFIMQYKNVDKRSALAFLDTLYPNYKSHKHSRTDKDLNQPSFLFPTQSDRQASSLNNKPEQYRDFEFLESLPLKSALILNYLHSRGIPPRIASKYFRVVKYRHKEKPTSKPYFGFGMQNESGGWEVRSASDKKGEKFKTALIAKEITVIKGREVGRGEVSVFEGMTDFVSLLSMFNVDELKGDTIILHGLKLYGRAATYIHDHAYSRINTFLDNNTSGMETTEKFINDFGSRVVNQSPKFAPYVDLNDALKDGYKPLFISQSDMPQP